MSLLRLVSGKAVAVVVVVIHGFCPLAASAQSPVDLTGSVRLEWDPSDSPSVVGYKLHYGLSSLLYTSTLDVGSATTVTVSNLVRGLTYYFAATAYNSGSVESGFSNELVVRVPDLTVALVANPASVATVENAPVPVTLTASGVVQVALQYKVISGPSHGTLQGNAPDLTYVPAADYVGNDSFAFTVSDLLTESAPATVRVTIHPTNDVPIIDLGTHSMTCVLDHGMHLLAPQALVIGAPSESLVDWLLTVTVGDQPALGDTLGVGTNAGLEAIDGSISSEGTVIATYAGDTNGSSELQFSFNSNANVTNLQQLIRSLTFSIDAQQTGSSNRLIHFSLTDATGATASAKVLSMALDHPPFAMADRVCTGVNLPITIPFARLLANDSDLDGDPVNIASVNSESLYGGTLLTSDTGVTFTPASDFAGFDQFAYQVQDSRGGAATGTVLVKVLAQGQLGIEDLPQAPTATNHSATIVFAGIPATSYRLFASDDLVHWLLINTSSAPATGLIRFYDAEAGNSPNRFYRVMVP